MKKIVIVFLLLSGLFAASNTAISFQGKLLDNTGAAITNGSQTMTFTLYDALTGGTQITNATWTQAVSVQNGIYAVELDVQAVNLTNVTNAYMEVKVGSETLSPRIHLTSSAFAQKAATATTANNLNASIVSLVGVNGNPNYLRIDNRANTNGGNWRVGETGAIGFGAFGVYNETTSLQPFTIAQNGNVGVGTTAPTAKLEVNGNIISKAQVFKAYLTAIFSHPSSWVKIPFNAVAFDNLGGTFNASTNQYTVGKSGYYRISVTGYSTTASTASDRYAIGCFVNAEASPRSFTGGNYSAGDTPLAGYSSIQYVAVGQPIEIRMFSAIPASLGAGNSGGHCMYWDMEYIGN